MVKDVHNPSTNRQPYTVEYAYDHQGRMVWKQVSANSAVISTRNLVWDNYNIIAETIHSTIPSIQSSTNLYVWGLDLSGSLQGAGGVGGLLAVTTVSNPGTLEPLNPETFFPCFDANGNVTEYADDSGAIVAHYEYSPFGETVVQSGDLADAFTHRFSTKPFDTETGLVVYQLRPYSPPLGRWLSRDPIGDIQPSDRRRVVSRVRDPEVLELLKGLSDVMPSTDMADVDLLLNDTLTQEANLYAALFNAPINQYDPDGRLVPVPCPITGKALCALVIGVIQKYQTAPNWRYTHCMASCRIKKVCGLGTAIGAGLAKELWDLAKCAKDIVLTGKADSDACYSAFQPSDFEDNAKGYKCPKNKTCAEQCQNLKDEPDAPPGPFYKCCRK